MGSDQGLHRASGGKSERTDTWDLRVMMVTKALKEMGCHYPGSGVLKGRWTPGLY